MFLEERRIEEMDARGISGEVGRQRKIDTGRDDLSDTGSQGSGSRNWRGMRRTPRTGSYCYSKEFLEGAQEQCYADFIPKAGGVLKSKDGAFDPHSLHFFHPPIFVGLWAVLREALIVNGTLERKRKEVIAAFVSAANDCTFCTYTHMLFAQSSGFDAGLLRKAVAAKNPHLLKDKSLTKIIRWAVAAQTRGVPNTGMKQPFLTSEAQEILSLSFYFNYMNRVVDTYLTRERLLPTIPAFIRFLMKKSRKINDKMEKRLIKEAFGAIQTDRIPGQSAAVMDRNPALPKDFYWVAENKPIADAIAYWVWAMDDMAAMYIPTTVQQFVQRYISQNYNGADMKLSKRWAFSVADAFGGTPAEKCAVAFMLLVSFSRFEVDRDLMNALEEFYPCYDTRRAFGMWSAFHTARTIACWQCRKCFA